MQLAVKFIFYVIDTLQAPVEDGSLCYGLPCPDPGTLHQCPANENKARAFYIGMLYIPPNNCLYKSSTNVGKAFRIITLLGHTFDYAVRK